MEEKRKKILNNLVEQIIEHRAARAAAQSSLREGKNGVVSGKLLLNGKPVELNNVIGRGCFGLVFRGTYDQKTVAVKAVWTNQIGWEEYVTRHVQSPYLATTIGWINDRQVSFLVMEYTPYGSLYEFWKVYNFSPRMRMRCMLDISKGVKYLHVHGIVHRDIKPDNFVIGLGEKANLLHLIDLGLCKRYWNPTTNSHIMF